MWEYSLSLKLFKQKIFFLHIIFVIASEDT